MREDVIGNDMPYKYIIDDVVKFIFEGVNKTDVVIETPVDVTDGI